MANMAEAAKVEVEKFSEAKMLKDTWEALNSLSVK